MGNAGQHFGALGDLAADAFAHGDKGGGGLADFLGPFGLEARRFPPLAEIVRRLGQPADGFDLVAHENYGNREQDQ